MSIPLVQKAEKDDINTSIIAIKRNIERINMLLGLSNSEEIDTSKFATKEELQQAVTDLQPVDEVAVDNMQSVSSNAVANALGNLAQLKMGDLPRNANNAGVVGKMTIYYGYADPSNLTNYPSFSWSSAGNYPFWFLIDFAATPRETQILFVTYYDGNIWKVARQYKRGRVDVTWFGWVEIT